MRETPLYPASVIDESKATLSIVCRSFESRLRRYPESNPDI